jgi:hypothetical protein
MNALHAQEHFCGRLAVWGGTTPDVAQEEGPPACQASLADQMFGESQVLADHISAPGLTNADLPILA